jgi:hypothetical protein
LGTIYLHPDYAALHVIHLVTRQDVPKQAMVHVQHVAAGRALLVSTYMDVAEHLLVVVVHAVEITTAQGGQVHQLHGRHALLGPIRQQHLQPLMIGLVPIAQLVNTQQL